MLSSKYRKIAKQLKGQNKAKKIAVDTGGSDVMYIGHLPHGFFEQELKGYFTQFGKVKAVRVSRSKRTAKSRGYAFVRFEDAEVAGIAAKAMDGYMMYSSKLVCRVVPPDKLHSRTLEHSNRTWHNIDWHKRELARANRQRTPAERVARNVRAVQRDAARQAKLRAAGIEYDYPSLAEQAGIDLSDLGKVGQQARELGKEQKAARKRGREEEAEGRLAAARQTAKKSKQGAKGTRKAKEQGDGGEEGLDELERLAVDLGLTAKGQGGRNGSKASRQRGAQAEAAKKRQNRDGAGASQGAQQAAAPALREAGEKRQNRQGTGSQRLVKGARVGGEDVDVEAAERRLRELEGQIEAHLMQVMIAREDGDEAVALDAAQKARALQLQAEELSERLVAAGLVEDEDDHENADNEAFVNETPSGGVDDDGDPEGATDREDEKEQEDEDEDGKEQGDEDLVTSGDAFVPTWAEFAEDMEDLRVQAEGRGGLAQLGGDDLAQLKQLVELAREAREEEERAMQAETAAGAKKSRKKGARH